MGKIPHKIEEGGGGFFDRPIRDLWISGLGIALGILAALWLPVPIFIKVAVALLIAGLGLAIGLGRDQGVWRLEERLVQVIRHRRRVRKAVWRKETPEDVPVGISTVVEEEPEPQDRTEGRSPVGPPIDLWWGIVTAFVFAMMGGVTAWLFTGGIDEILLWYKWISQ